MCLVIIRWRTKIQLRTNEPLIWLKIQPFCVQLRSPRFRYISISVGLFIGAAVALSLPWLWPDAPANAVEVGVLVTLLGWTAAEQFSAEIDRAVAARLYWLFAIAGVLPLAGALGARIFAGSTVSHDVLARAVLFALVSVVPVSCGSGRYALLRLQSEPVRGNAFATKSRLYTLPLSMVYSSIALLLLQFVLHGTVSLHSLIGPAIGGVIGASIGSLLTDERTVELVALDDGLIITTEGGFGASFVPWRRIRDVRRDGDTLRVARGLPWPMVYEADLSRDNRSDETVYAFQSRIR